MPSGKTLLMVFDLQLQGTPLFVRMVPFYETKSQKKTGMSSSDMSNDLSLQQLVNLMRDEIELDLKSMVMVLSCPVQRLSYKAPLQGGDPVPSNAHPAEGSPGFCAFCFRLLHFAARTPPGVGSRGRVYSGTSRHGWHAFCFI